MSTNNPCSATTSKSNSNILEDTGTQAVKINKTLKTLQFSNPGSKFSFEARGKRKVRCPNQFDSLANRALYDEDGIMITGRQDICDCLRKDCPGCHFPCKQCKSTKCGNKCRCNRMWYYEKIEIEGLSKTLEMQIEK